MYIIWSEFKKISRQGVFQFFGKGENYPSVRSTGVVSAVYTTSPGSQTDEPKLS